MKKAVAIAPRRNRDWIFRLAARLRARFGAGRGLPTFRGLARPFLFRRVTFAIGNFVLLMSSYRAIWFCHSWACTEERCGLKTARAAAGTKSGSNSPLRPWL